ncbi:MAG TPA: ABC transporter ATP-binding protein [Candidatus Kapabacteria bacterium]|nr:ABC transporter ATP-binding protein [Candidatus Kapabacteria bacterium]HRK59413.1 ABC transporter ATP-binding protein [Candidatus Kapabacteria bacterium]
MISEKKEKLVEVKNLHTHFNIEGKWAKAVNGVSFDIYKGEVLGLVGESGSGKSVTSLSLMKLIPDPPGRIVDGEIWFKNRDIVKMSYEDMYTIRGKEIAMIFQEPMTSLNPVFPIGMQIAEVIMVHEKLGEADARKKAIEMLQLVGIPDPEKRLDDYPHQFSGGMRQRVMIAIALACNPSLLIADEPTTALDVTIQAQILELMLELKEKRKEAAILLITHDLAVVAEMCHRVIVMYGGVIQEIAEVMDLFDRPLHPYTRGLMKSIPHTSKGSKLERLEAIPGNVPSILNFPVGCKFCTRCAEKVDICETTEPPLIEIAPEHFVRCHLVKPGSLDEVTQ